MTTGSPDIPTPGDILAWCAAAAPAPWFPSTHAQQTGIPRDALDEPLWLLRQTELLYVADWVRGAGQGYALTPAGEKVLADPTRLTDARPVPQPDLPVEDADLAKVPVPDPTAPPPPQPALTTYDRGERVRAAFLAPPRASIVVPILVAVNVLWFVAAIVVAYQAGVPFWRFLREGDNTVLLRVGAAYGPSMLGGEWWRLITCGFVHGGGVHLIANLFSLILIGPVAEGLWGRKRFAVLYAVAGFAAACAATAVHPSTIIAGASGSIWGIQLSVVLWLIRYREHLPQEAVSEWLRQLALVIGINLLVSLTPGVSLEGHLAGGVAGFVAAVCLDWVRSGAGRLRVVGGVVGLTVAVAALVGGYAVFVHTDADWRVVRERHNGKAVLDQHQALVQERGQLIAELRTGKVSRDRVRRVDDKVVEALSFGRPVWFPPARDAVKWLRADVKQVADQLPAPVDGKADPFVDHVRAYLVAVDRFAAAADERLAAGTLPTMTEWKILAGRRNDMDAAWEQLVLHVR
ncbi:rhomboid family intramembrane serine protease [Fimbriiglobus ruber]|uniref:Rhomboid family serine protease n=1 Tax=Fimbriiglobus ruber TaxID=1908690 RepID=A0A225DZT5_9BACT|nr:rhomboid family intramembrane serine protease [Fimbriiglobus ruber]OWK41885.1 rhomboid family serine protease [Fimbriiglobus ruber]